MHIEVISLGCPKNLVDTENMMGILSKDGCSISSDGGSADILLINTCAFIEDARQEAYREIEKGIKAKAEGKYKSIIVAGCLPEMGKNKLLKKFPELDKIIGVPKQMATSKTPRLLATLPATAYIKIADGCNNICSYCTVPIIRGRFRSRKIDDIVAEAKNLSNAGVKEIVLIAQDTTQYPDLANLLRQLAKIKDLMWIRLMYAHPKHLTDEIINVLADEPKICKYIDLPLQHSSDKILNRMGRHSSRAKIVDLIYKLRRRIPDLVIRSSFIIGFPGETKRDFSDLVEFLSEFKLEKVGFFKYSREKGTYAARLRGQVPRKTKELRYKRIIKLQNQISREIGEKLIGSIFEVLIEAIKGDAAVCRSCREAPDIDGFVVVKNRSFRVGEIINVKIIGCNSHDLAAVPVS